jgi:hypothetical protein
MLKPKSSALKRSVPRGSDHQQERGFNLWVMRDPSDNEFCVLETEFPEVLAKRESWNP